MKVLIINPLSSGGITQYTICLSDALQHYSDLILLTSQDVDYEYRSFFDLEEYKQLKDKISYKLSFPKSTNRISKIIIYIYNFINIINIVKKNNIDIVHIQWPLSVKFDKYLINKLHKLNVKVIFTAHNVVSHEYNNMDFLAQKNMLNAYDKIIVHANCNKKDIIELFNIEWDKIDVIPHGNYLFINSFNKYIEREYALKELGLDNNNFYLLFFGYIREYKGLDILLNALSKLDNNIHLIIAGSCSNFSKYDDLIEQFKLDNRVHKFIKYIDLKDFGKYFYASDAVIFPYKNIYQSGAVQMAMAFKKPIIVSSVGGLIETIKDNDNGLIFKNEDVDDLIEKINILYKNNELRNTIANNGYNYAKNELDWDKIAYNTYNLYIGNGK